VVLSALSLGLLAGQAAAAETRVALVIGNAAYDHAPALANPVHDARGIAAALRRLGFQVEQGIDLDTTNMHLMLRRFAEQLQEADVGLFFYAGHALQVRGKNYLAPIDANLRKESDLLFEGIDLELILRLLEEQPRTSIVFLDACRDNPLARNLARTVGRTRSQMIGQGLAGVESGIGTLIAYATQPDSVALDGAGRNSPFTAALLEHIEVPGIEIRQMLSRVRRAVIDATERRQVPWDHSSLTGDFYLHPAALQAEEAQLAPPAAQPGRSGSDVVVWSVIQGSTNANDFRIFLQNYPESPFVPFAQSRLTALGAQPDTSGPSTAREASVVAPQAALEDQRAVEEQVAAAPAREAASEPSTLASENIAEPADAALAGQLEGPDAALAALLEEAASAAPALDIAPVDAPTTPAAAASEPSQEMDTAALTAPPAPADASQPPATVEQAQAVEQALGLSPDDWRAVQRALNALNHPAGPEDGLPGQQTRAALRAWQQATGSGPTGHLTGGQHARLLEQAAPQVALVVATGPMASSEDAPLHECDRLAGHPSDADRVGPGVAWEDLEPKRALAACATAMREHPDEARFQYQYGRALLRLGSADDARLWFRTTAEQGYVVAQRNVGHLYMLSLGVPRDDDEAATWYRRAAEQSDPRAQYLLGMMYLVGLGVARDDAQAVTWLRQAAEQGDRGAQFVLGWLYAQGRGVPRDLAEAAAWYRRAAEQGDRVASAALQRLPN
jgi:uncharacterized caspase-like protein/TPR repeat protein